MVGGKKVGKLEMACRCAVTRRTLIRPAGVHWPTFDSQLDVPVQLWPIPLTRAQ